MKRIISLLLAMAMLLSCLAACGGESSSSGSSQSSQQESSESQQESSSESKESSEPSAENTGAGEPIEFSLFVDMTWFWFDKWGTEPVSQKITETTGVSFDVTRASDGQ